MKKLIPFFFIFWLTTHTVANAQEKPAITWQDIPSWDFIRTSTSTLSPDGQWLTWVSGPTEGDLTLSLRHTQDTLTYTFPIGATSTNAAFSDDSRYMAYRESAKEAEAKAAQKSRKPTYSKLHVISLPDTQKVVFEKIKGFNFSGENAEWIAISFAPPENAPKGDNAPKGGDLLLYQLASKVTFNLGNVSEFSFNKAGNYLAYTIDASGQNGNGVFLRDMNTGVTTALDNDKAAYSKIRWNEEGTAFALLKANKNEKYKSPVYSVMGIRHINGDKTATISYSGIDDSAFPEGQGISEHGSVYWSDDLSMLFFGLGKLEKKEGKTGDGGEKTDVTKDSTAVDTTQVAKVDSTDSKDSTSKKAVAAKPKAKEDIEKPDMIIWNWQDKRLQSAQQVQQNRDKNFNFASAYRVKGEQFVRLADSNMRAVSIGPKELYALGYDYTPYEFTQ